MAEDTTAMDTDTLIEETESTENTTTSAATEVETPQEAVESKGEAGDIVSKAFTTVDENAEVQYVTMTPEEAAAAGVEEEEQVVTTSLQFDPANPSVLYAADGTLINQEDLSPEEQALVQAALQQHLAEQEAEQQLAMIDQGTTGSGEMLQQPPEPGLADASASAAEQALETTDMVTDPTGDVVSAAAAVESPAPDALTIDPVAVITPATNADQSNVASSVNLASPSTNATQIVQTLADNVRRQQEYLKAQTLLKRVKSQTQTATKTDLPEGYRYEEKIVIRQGQPQVVKLPVKTAPTASTKRPEIPAALANLMPKIEVGKDGSQVIRIHQSQISADQLKSLQENPNVRLVFRPASSSKARGGMGEGYPRKRGRPRKSYGVGTHQTYKHNEEDLSPSKTRYGRTTKLPYYQKDYLSADLENGDAEMDDGTSSSSALRKYPIVPPPRRGRPPGSLNRNTMDRGYRRTNTYARKIEQLREQEFQHDEELNNARLSIVPQKPILSSVELAISTRRKNRLRELLGACSEEEIMEVALPHLARVFSLWEFLVMKVEKNKLSRVYFADVYKEYEILHRYVTRLTDKYKEVLSQESVEKQREVNEDMEGTEQSLQNEKKSFLKVRCKKLAQSLGLEQDELEDAFITLLDSQDVTSSHLQKCQSTADQQDTKAEAHEANANQTATETDSNSNTQSLLKADMAESSSANPTGSDEASENKSVPAEEAAQTTEGSDEAMEVDQAKPEKSDGTVEAAPGEGSATTEVAQAEEGTASGTQIIQIGTGDDKQFIEVPEGYTLIQTPEGLVMSQPGTTLSQAEDGTIYVTQEDGTTAPLDAQKGVPLETVESLLSLEGQQSQG